jgi:hypothetical protein
MDTPIIWTREQAAKLAGKLATVSETLDEQRTRLEALQAGGPNKLFIRANINEAIGYIRQAMLALDESIEVVER